MLRPLSQAAATKEKLSSTRRGWRANDSTEYSVVKEPREIEKRKSILLIRNTIFRVAKQKNHGEAGRFVGMVELRGIEPLTSGLQSPRSPS